MDEIWMRQQRQLAEWWAGLNDSARGAWLRPVLEWRAMSGEIRRTAPPDGHLTEIDLPGEDVKLSPSVQLRAFLAGRRSES